MSKDSEWVGKQSGKLRIVAMIRPSTQGRSALFRARCSCGRMMAVTSRDLEVGIEDCGCAATAEKKIHEQPAPREIDVDIVRMQRVVNPRIFEHYQTVQSMCPYWWATSLPQVVSGVCNMLARGKYTNDFVARWWDCPVSLVNIVAKVMSKHIKELHDEYEELNAIYTSIVGTPPVDGIRVLSEEWGGFNSLRQALSARSLAGHWQDSMM